jgi:hypothetical protein
MHRMNRCCCRVIPHPVIFLWDLSLLLFSLPTKTPAAPNPTKQSLAAFCDFAFSFREDAALSGKCF